MNPSNRTPSTRLTRPAKKMFKKFVDTSGEV
jgi:hypothetical protein